MTHDNRQAGTDEIKLTEEMIEAGAKVIERYLEGSWSFTYAPEIAEELFTIMLSNGGFKSEGNAAIVESTKK